jgi:RNA polymerase sigma-70 factor (ECF subfamily)
MSEERIAQVTNEQFRELTSLCRTHQENGKRISSEADQMHELETTADMLLMTGQLRTSTQAAKHEADEEALVRAVVEGDRDRFGKLYGLYAPLVHGILLSRVPHGEVDDLVQDIFLHAFNKLHTLRNRTAFGPWIAMIARNRAMDFHRQAKTTVEITEDLRSTEAPPPEALEVLGYIRALPEAYRETLVLRLVEGMTGPEIALRTGLTPASVRVNLHRGMKLLRGKLGLSKENV